MAITSIAFAPTGALAVASSGGTALAPSTADQISQAITAEDNKITAAYQAGDSAVSATITAAYQAAMLILPLGGGRYGLDLSNGSTPATDVGVATGFAVCDTAPYQMLTLAAALNKKLDVAWVVGSGGGRDTGAIADGTWHVWLIAASGVTADVLLSLSATSPTMPTGYTLKRRIGSVIRKTAVILPFTHNGRIFLLATRATDYNSTSNRANALLTLTIPAGVRVQPLISGQAGFTSNGTYTLTISDGSDSSNLNPRNLISAGQLAGAGSAWQWGGGGLFSNLSSQIFFAAVSANWFNNTLYTHGWIDECGLHDVDWTT